MPIAKFKQLRAQSDDQKIKQNIAGFEDALLQLIKVDDESDCVDLNVFCELVDLFTYYPKKPVKQHPGRGSSNIYRVMSSNIKDGPTADKPEGMSAD